LIRYHRLIFDRVRIGVFRSTYLPWIDSITRVRAGEKEEIEPGVGLAFGSLDRARTGTIFAFMSSAVFMPEKNVTAVTAVYFCKFFERELAELAGI
jgi:hypothetical protein